MGFRIWLNRRRRRRVIAVTFARSHSYSLGCLVVFKNKFLSFTFDKFCIATLYCHCHYHHRLSWVWLWDGLFVWWPFYIISSVCLESSRKQLLGEKWSSCSFSTKVKKKEKRGEYLLNQLLLKSFHTSHNSKKSFHSSCFIWTDLFYIYLLKTQNPSLYFTSKKLWFISRVWRFSTSVYVYII